MECKIDHSLLVDMVQTSMDLYKAGNIIQAARVAQEISKMHHELQVPKTDRLIKILGDGNCFFRSILEALTLKNISPFMDGQEGHAILREMVVESLMVSVLLKWKAMKKLKKQ